MSIDPKLLISNFSVILGTLSLLIAGKAILVAFVGRIFGISSIAAIRVGLLLAPGGEFAFVAFGEAVNQVGFSKLSIMFVVPLGMLLCVRMCIKSQHVAPAKVNITILRQEKEWCPVRDTVFLCLTW